MTGIFSAITGQFTRAIALSTFFPCTVFSLLLLILLQPFVPPDWAALEALRAVDPLWRIVVVTLCISVLTGILFNLNTPIIRFYEGYPWQGTWIGRNRTYHYQVSFEKAQRRRRALRELIEFLETISETDDGESKSDLQKRIGRLEIEWSKVGRQLNEQFPAGRESVLPTRLGNVIRSFEDYPDQQYRMKGITLWTRLISKISKDYVAIIDDTKVRFDFLLNCSVLSILMMTLLVVAAVLNVYPLFVPGASIVWLLELLFFGVLSHRFYLASIEQAGMWGLMVRGAFDLYRHDLLKQLGYAHVPANIDEERAMWSAIADRMIFGESIAAWPDEFADRPAYARSASDLVQLELLRGIYARPGEDSYSVTIEVRHPDPEGDEAIDVVVTDTLPVGFEYQWGSAMRLDDNGSVQVSGTNPYRFKLGTLRGTSPANVAILRYRAVPCRR